MSKDIILTESEILNTPNDYSLGELARIKYWTNKEGLKGNPDSLDVCVICGKETPYLRSVHIDYRIGYVEGSGQGCYQPNICDRV